MAGSASRFDWCFAQAGDPAASFASLLTGLYPTTSGVLEAGDRLPDDAVTLAEAMSATGLTTAAFVEGAPGGDDFGLRQGFSVYEASAEPGAAAKQWLRDHAGEASCSCSGAGRLGLTPRPRARSTEWSRRGLRRAPPGGAGSSRSDSPAAFEPSDLDYLRLLYARRVGAADRALGDLRAELEELGLAKRTTLIVAGTAGLDLGQHGPTGVRSLHATVTRVPLMVSIPGGRGAARASTRWSSSSTSCRPSSSCRASHCRRRPGSSLLPLIDGTGGRPTSRSPRRRRSAASGRWPSAAAPGPVARRRAPALYDLAADPAELTDVAAANADKVAVMERHSRPGERWWLRSPSTPSCGPRRSSTTRRSISSGAWAISSRG